MRQVVGQDASIATISDAICDHMSRIGHKSNKPLVLSLHGPPGVGKTYFHQLAAHALYQGDVPKTKHCPGKDCLGYKVLFGMDYTEKDKDRQHLLLQKSLLEHVGSYPQSFIVVEEYDKLDCFMRGFFRQIMQVGVIGNYSLHDSIIVLESNLGYSLLHGMLEKSGGRNNISIDQAQKELKDMVFKWWTMQKCEDFSDTQKLMRSIDFFLPFYPLERSHITQLFKMKLDALSKQSEQAGYGKIHYGDQVLSFLAGKVEFDGQYPIEGGKETNTVTVRYLQRPLRRWMEEIESTEDKARTSERHTWVLHDNGRSLKIV